MASGEGEQKVETRQETSEDDSTNSTGEVEPSVFSENYVTYHWDPENETAAPRVLLVKSLREISIPFCFGLVAATIVWGLFSYFTGINERALIFILGTLGGVTVFFYRGAGFRHSCLRNGLSTTGEKDS